MSAVDLETQFTEWMEQSQHLWNANTRLLAGNYTIDKEVVTKPQHLSLEVYITLTSNFTLGLELSLSSSSFVPFETCNLQFPWRAFKAGYLGKAERCWRILARISTKRQCKRVQWLATFGAPNYKKVWIGLWLLLFLIRRTQELCNKI